MAVDEISSTNPVLPSALQARVQTPVSLAASPLGFIENPTVVAKAAAQNLSPAQQAALLGSEAVQILKLEPASSPEPLLGGETNTALTRLLEAEGLSPAQQAALATNETVQAALENENLTPAQQAALTVSQATQTLATPLTEAGDTTATATSGIAERTPFTNQGEAIATGETQAGIGTGTTTGAAEAQTPTTAGPAARETTVANATANLAQPMAAHSLQLKNALAVYELRNPTPPPAEPSPIRREINPAVPVGRARAVDPLVLRQEWEKRRKNRQKDSGQLAGSEPRTPLAEKAVLDMVKHTNERLAADGIPLHLVFSKTEDTLALDIYECLDGASCEITQEVPLDLNHLLTTLDNLEHETGIIVNIKT